MTHRGDVHEVRAPARIDLAGGTVDIWPICLIERDAVTVNLAIDRFAIARVRTRDDGRFVLSASDRGLRVRHDDTASLLRETSLPLHREVALLAAPHGGLEIATRSGVPAGSGLGGSSTLFVAATLAALRAVGRTLTPDALLRHVIDMEARIIGVPTGAQDYVSAIWGGLSEIRYPPGGATRTAIARDADAVAKRIVLVYTGLPHDSATNNWAVTKAYLDGDADVRTHLRAISRAAASLRDALAAEDLDAAAVAISSEWEARRRLAPGVSTRKIDALGAKARRAGALAMKVCGAGGAGCVFFWGAEGRRAAVTDAVRRGGAEILRFRAAKLGAR